MEENQCKPNTCLYWTQKLVTRRFGLDRFVLYQLNSNAWLIHRHSGNRLQDITLNIICFTEDESKLLEEVTTSMATSRLRMRDPFIGGLPKLDTTRGLLSNQNTPRMSNTSSLGIWFYHVLWRVCCEDKFVIGHLIFDWWQ